jgi:hypothetical protein
MKSTKAALLLLTAIIILSRIFFLNAGFGSEEDAWGVALTAKHIAQSGEYEASRLPGHPLQELFYASLWNKTNAFGMNAITALFSVLASIYFYLILKKLNFEQPFLATLALAFTPIIYIHSSDSMDYVWALAFMMMSYYWLLNDRIVFSGILLGMAVGCRITSGVLIIPFIIQLVFNNKESWKKIITLGIFFGMTSLVIFFPVFQKYGWGFFHYYDQFPYPSFAKVLYKASIGVWGSIGCLELLFLLMKIMIYPRRTRAVFMESNGMMFSWITAIILYIGLYFMLPQKSAYFIPIVPFIILFAGKYLPSFNFKMLSFSIIISSFFFGINLSDKTRGAEASNISKTIVIGGQEVHLDLLHGPVIDDNLKRKARMNFTQQIIETIPQLKTKSVIISGWWLNPILFGMKDNIPGNIKLVYVMDEPDMKGFSDNGFTIYYLPEMDSINDLRFKITSTKTFALPLSIDNL